MIERLTAGLGVLARISPAELSSAHGRRIAADCADAIRLELDCPQQELTAGQRTALSALGDLLDAPADATAIRGMATIAAQALGVRIPGLG
jgi:hypothetical protein